MDDGDISCHLVLVPSYLHEFDDANKKVGADRNPQKTEVIYYVKDLNATPLAVKIDEVRKLASVSTVTAGNATLGVAVGPWQFIAESNTRTCSAVPGPADRICSLPGVHGRQFGATLSSAQASPE